MGTRARLALSTALIALPYYKDTKPCPADISRYTIDAVPGPLLTHSRILSGVVSSQGINPRKLKRLTSILLIHAGKKQRVCRRKQVDHFRQRRHLFGIWSWTLFRTVATFPTFFFFPCVDKQDRCQLS